MSDTKKSRREALEEFKRAARMFQSVLDVAQHLESLESLDQSAREAESRSAAADLIVGGLRAENARLRAESETTMAATKQQIEMARDLARQEVAGMMAAAERAVAGLKDAAAKDVDATVARGVAERDVIAREAGAVRAELALDRDMLLDAKGTLAQMQEQIAAARAIVKNLMGGV